MSHWDLLGGDTSINMWCVLRMSYSQDLSRCALNVTVARVYNSPE